MGFNKFGSLFFKLRDKLPLLLLPGILLSEKLKKGRLLCGLSLLAAGEALRLWAVSHIGPTSRTRNVCADVLVKTGPYALTRNPLYLANSVKILGFAIISGNFIFALALILFYGLEYSSVIPFEQEFLEGRFKDDYAKYKNEVPVFFPALKSFANNPDIISQPKFSLKEVICSEKHTFASTLGLLLLFVSAPALANRIRRQPK